MTRQWRMALMCVYGILLAFLAACGGNQVAETVQKVETADLVLTNGVVITMDEAQPRTEAVAVKDGRILAVGDSQSLGAYIGVQTRIVDLQGAMAMPGFIEGHGHLKSMGIAKMNLNLAKVNHWQEVIDMVSEAVGQQEPGTWIVGRGWHQEKWDRAPENDVNGYPHHQALSDVSPENPVLLTHASGHALFANAKAMELAGISAQTPDPPGGSIIRDAGGNPIGVFEETAEGLIRRARSESEAGRSAEQVLAHDRRALNLAIEECLAKGITSFQDAGSSFEDLDLYKTLADEGRLGIRLWVMAGDGNDRLKEKLSQYQLSNYGDHYLTLGGIKRYVDGALGSRGAWLLAPYEDLPDSTGQNVMPLEYLRQAGNIALEHGLQLCTHAIGDRGNREVLDLYESLLQGNDARWRIEHVQHLHPDDIPRFAQLGVIASMQAVHCTSDAPFVVKRLGERRAREGAYMWRALLESGAVVTNGTDVPVEDVDPLANLYATVTRKLKDGTSFFPSQALTMEQALRGYTLDNAFAASEEQLKGSLQTGKLADITVLSQDLTTISADRILETEVLYTIVGGEIRYQKPPAP